MSYYRIAQVRNTDNFRVTLLAHTGEVMLYTRDLLDLDDARGLAKDMQRLGALGRFKMRETKDGRHFYVLLGPNDDAIAYGHYFHDKGMAERSMRLARELAKSRIIEA